ncbi:hypothetical protein HDU67_004979 [Dinochytrium kinnereticum]|nr:hypothetical protein HDU67_004979 [Dinochytrium kinnereticum]
MTILRLPPELLVLFLPPFLDLRDLAHLCSVNKLLRRILRHELFKTLNSQCTSFERLKGILTKHPELASHTRCLNIVFREKHEDELVDQMCTVFALVAPYLVACRLDGIRPSIPYAPHLERCRELSSLSIRIPGLMRSDQLRHMGAVLSSLKKLHELEISIDVGQPMDSSLLIQGMIDSMPAGQLRKFSLKGRYWTSFRIPFDFIARQHNLRDLDLDFCWETSDAGSDEHRSQRDYIRRCLSNLTLLEEFSISVEHFGPGWVPFFEKSVNLKRLKVRSFVAFGWSEFKLLLHQKAWPNLVELELILTKFSPSEYFKDVCAVLKAHPQLKSLKFHCHGTLEDPITQLSEAADTDTECPFFHECIETMDLRFPLKPKVLLDISDLIARSTGLRSLSMEVVALDRFDKQLTNDDCHRFLENLLKPQLKSLSLSFDSSDRYIRILSGILSTQKYSLNHLGVLCSAVDSDNFFRNLSHIVDALPDLTSIDIDMSRTLVFDVLNLQRILNQLIRLPRLSSIRIRDGVFTVLRRHYKLLVPLLAKSLSSLRSLEIISKEPVNIEEIELLEEIEQARRLHGFKAYLCVESCLRAQPFGDVPFERVWKVRKGLPKEAVQYVLDVQTRSKHYSGR